jgi:hypothetical protein
VVVTVLPKKNWLGDGDIIGGVKPAAVGVDITTVVKLVQFANAFSPILVTVFGIVMLVNPIEPLNAF